MTVDQMIDDLIEREGGFVNLAADRGGPTNMGITQATLDAWNRAHPERHKFTPDEIPEDWKWGPNGFPLHVRDLSQYDAERIYRQTYYLDPKIDHLPEPWQPLVFDWAVHSGPATAIKGLQKLLRVIAIDGIIGPKTIAAARDVLNSPLVDYLRYRREFCEALCARDPSQEVFLRGWLNRIDELERGLA